MLDLRPQVEKIVDSLDEQGFDAIYYLGIGGTYASAMQAVTYINGKATYLFMSSMQQNIIQPGTSV